MTADTFVANLKTLAPSRHDLMRNFQLSASEADSFRRSYDCPSRRQQLRVPGVTIDNPIMELIARYDLGKLEIVGVVFNRNTKAIGDKVIFGRVEGDLLAFDTTGHILVVSAESPDHVVSRCASNASAFLDALIEVTRHIAASCADPSIVENVALKRQAAERAASLAGGPAYLGFYLTALDASE